jgi:hypothetical protein
MLMLVLKLSLQTAATIKPARKAAYKVDIKAASIIPIIIDNETPALYARNPTTIPRNIRQRSKMPKKLDLGLKTSTNSVLRLRTPVILIYTSQMHTYST